MFKFIINFAFTLIMASSLIAQTPKVRQEDKIRIREAVNIANQFGERLWEGYSKPDFSLVLVADSLEYLFYHPNPGKDFIFLENDNVTGSKIYYRNRIFNKNFLATFPAVNGVNCIVVGLPENTTSKNSSRWVITLLHEHFHQFQYTYPDYYESVNTLDLTKGDSTGMWQINYPFPYHDRVVNARYNEYTKKLEQCIKSIGSKNFKRNLKTFLTRRNSFQESLSRDDYNYFSFQLWQEGIARYTEFKFLEMLNDYEPSKEFQTLPDFISFKDLKNNVYKNELKKITCYRLNEYQRECFYSIGLEGLILDRIKSCLEKEIFDR